MNMTDAKTINAVVNNLTAKLAVVVDKLHMPAKELMHIFCRQAVVDGIASIILGCVLGVVTAGLIYSFKKEIKSSREEDIWSTVIVISAIIVAVFLLVSVYDGFVQLANPMYWALNHLFKMIQGC